MKRFNSNKAASNTIEFLFVLVVIFLIFSILVDYNSWSINRNAIQAAAQNGARLVAVYGGDGGTEIEQKYGAAKSGGCAGSAVECFVVDQIKNTPLVGSVQVTNVDCGPSKVDEIGARTHCLVEYTWGGLAGSPLMTMDAFRNVRVASSSASEVMFKNDRKN